MTTGQSSDDARDVLAAALVFAVATGLVEACTAAFQIVVLHRIVGVSRDLFWMAPLSNLLFFLPAAVVMIGIGRLVKRPVRLDVAAAAFAFLCGFSLLLPHTQLATWAEAVLAIGVAVQVRRICAARPIQSRRVIGIAAIGLSAIAAVLSVASRAWHALDERRSLAALPAPGGAQPNVLLIIFDTVRRANLQLYGYARSTTPELVRWAHDGVIFDHATATAPWTLPSHASMFTGVQAGALRASWTTPLPADGPRTIAEELGARGYDTGGFVANHLYASWETGLDRGFVHYDDYRVTLRLILAHSSLGRSDFLNRILDQRSLASVKDAVRHFSLRGSVVPSSMPRLEDSVTGAFLEWQGTVTKRPFFAFLNYMTAHAPYRAREPFLSRFASAHDRPMDRYDAGIAALDHEVGRMLDTLRARGVLDNTIVIVTSDHGEQFGEHKLRGHANSLYLPLLEVPLMIRYPASVPAGAHVAPVVSMRDLAATILDLAGGRRQFAGVSLARYWNASATPPPAVVAQSDLPRGINVSPAFPNARSDMHSLVDDRFHYIRGESGREELYDYGADAQELHNLAADPAMQADLERLRREMASPSPR